METKKLMRCAIAEFLGMALFVYIGTGSAISTGEQLASSAAPTSASVARVLPIAFAFGIGILVQAYSFGHISGGHFNPAVTFCLFLIGECEPVQMAAYIAAQLGGATLGSLLLWASVSALNKDRSGTVTSVVGDPPFGLGANGLNPTLSQGNGCLLEFMGTLVLCSCVVMTAVDKKALSQGVPHMAPLAIGFAVFLAHIVLIPLTGCGINPARTFGPAIVNSFAGSKVWDDSYWIYFVGPFAASAAAAGIHFLLKECDDDEAAAAADDAGTSSEGEVPLKAADTAEA